MTPRDSTPTPDRYEITLDGIAHGGEAVGRLPQGKVCFVAHAIPGERVRVEVVEERAKWTRGRLLDVLEASPDRVVPPCPYAGPEQPEGPTRCGGCVFQHVAAPRQAAMKHRIVVEQLQRIGRFTDPPVDEVVEVAPFGYRTHARFAVDEHGRLGFRRLRSHDTVPIDRCLLLTEAAQAARDAAQDAWTGAEEVEVRSGVDGDALVVHPGPGGMPPLPESETPVALVGAGKPVDLRGDTAITAEVDGFRFRVSATSFFQPGPAGASTLARLVREYAEVRPGERVLDAYAGVGLFSRVLAEDGGMVTAVESHPAAARDARHNLEGHATVVRAEVERYARHEAVDQPVDVVVADPPRQGAGRHACRALARLGPRALVYVSCDPAAFARDARVLTEEGLSLVRVTPVDQFAQTAAIELVALFVPERALHNG